MHPNEALINQFYTSFQQHDGAAMGRCYHPDITFSDPVFTNLKGPEAPAMWRMLTLRGKDLKLTFSQVHADDSTGSAHWEAHYTFSTTGRKVVNIVEAKFRFKDGLIIDHQDSFSFWRWAGQALGTTGKLLGWTPFLHRKVQQQSKSTLERYMAKESARIKD